MGGVPRYVLQYADNDAIQNQLQAAIHSADLHLITSSVGLTATSDNVSHKLIHIIPRADYITPTLYFASAYIAESVSDRLLQYDVTGIIHWIEASADEAETAPLRGKFFEKIGHRLIAAGGEFECRQLNNATTVPHLVRLQPTHIKHFSEVSQIITKESGTYWKPKPRNFPAVDGVQLPNRFYQYTVSLKHPIAAKRFKEVLEALKLANKTVNLYFVVPESIYSIFKTQHYGVP